MATCVYVFRRRCWLFLTKLLVFHRCRRFEPDMAAAVLFHIRPKCDTISQYYITLNYNIMLLMNGALRSFAAPVVAMDYKSFL